MEEDIAMKKYTQHAWFTLIELIVSIAIFWVIMISVMSIFLFSSQMSTRIELNRIMQENIKNVMENIAEEVRKWKVWEDNWINGRKNATKPDNASDDCTEIWIWNVWTKLCLENGTEYTIWYLLSDWSWSASSNMSLDCSQIDDECRVLKRESEFDPYYPLTNNFTHIENLSFRVTDEKLPRVIISLKMRPAARKWLLPSIIEWSTVQVQTTVSERLIETQ